MNVFLMRALLALTLAASMVVLTPRSAGAVPPTCVDMTVGVPHNTALPIFIACSGGTGAGSPDVLVNSGPTKGTLDVSAGGTSTTQWLTYTPSPGQSGVDSFTYRGVSAGSGSGGSDEIGPTRTVQVLIAAGTPPTCDSDSASVPHADGTPTPTTLFLNCDASGDPITGFAVVQAPEHGTLDTDELASGVLRYTPAAGYSGPDSLTFRATSSCGGANCQSALASVALTVLAGPSVRTVERLFVAASAARLTTTAGRQVPVPFVVTTRSLVRLDVLRDGRRVDRTSRTVTAGRRAVVWDGRLGARAARTGRYALVLTATSGAQRSVDRSVLVLTRPR